jgi:protein-S-isoprenylcysteine O-methyltransferase Ste14
MKYLLLCILWITWCFLHSFFTNTETTIWFRERLGSKFVYYRICYNLFSLVTVLPLLYWQGTIEGPVVIPLSPVLEMIKLTAVLSSIAVIAGSFFSFDTGDFLGTKQLGKKEEKKEVVISKHGFYGIVRHPMYFAGVIFFVAMMTDARLSQFLGYFILAVYMVIGTFREDRRLANELGDIYRKYQKEVPLLLPKIFNDSNDKKP